MRRSPAALCFALFSFFSGALSLSAASTAGYAATTAAPAAGDRTAELPIRRVVLYKNGIGYFEHRGRVSGDEELNIRFTTAQLNDVLKSLTVVDLNGGRVGGVRYNSTAPLSERLGTLRLALDGNTNRASFLNALRGARVEVHSGGSAATGRLLSVENVTHQDKNGNAVEGTEISLVSDSGELHSFDLTPSTSVRILEGEMTREVGRYMALLASARDKDVRQMTISTAGEGAREVVVSYISEVPVWKSTYRIVLPKNPEDKPLLQGWAVVDNTVGEDWKNVQLSLVAGAPQSFVEQISQPYYVRRPVVELPKTAQFTPQTHEGAENAPAPPTLTAGVVGGALGRGVGSGTGSGVGPGHGGGYGGGSYKVGTSVDAQAAPLDDKPYEQSFESQSSGEALGDMFEYAIKQNVTVMQNQSALVPIVQARVEAEKVTLWNDKQQTPLRSLWLTNSSGLTLDAGSFNIVEGGAFAGEGLLAEIHPHERRLLSYAADTAVRVNSVRTHHQRPFVRLQAYKGYLRVTTEQRETRTYKITNTDTVERSVVIEHPIRAGWEFSPETPKPDETSSSYHRFRIKVAPSAGAELQIAEFAPQQRSYSLTNFDQNTFEFLVKSPGGIDLAIETQLRKLLDKRLEIAEIEKNIKDRHDHMDGITAEQGRIRENMKSLNGSAEEKALLQRYVAELNQQEDKLAQLKSEISTKELELSARQGEFNQMAESMAFDQSR